MLSAETRLLLAEPLDPTRVSKRDGGGGRQLSYLEGHDVIRTANRIFGVGNWGYVVKDLVQAGQEQIERNGKVGAHVGYLATVEVWIKSDGYGAVTISDVGYGDGQDYGSFVKPHELAAKEAVTDGVKRCLKNFGDQFGLILYDKEAVEHDGGKRDELATLKNALIEEAQRRAVPMTPEAIAEEFGLTVDELQDAAAIRRALIEPVEEFVGA